MKRYGIDSIQSLINLAGCFYISTTVLFISGATGIIYAAYVDIAQLTRAEASWIMTFRHAITLVTGPLVAFLCTRLSIRSISALGILIAGIGAAACYFSLNFYYLLVFNILQGIGLRLSVTLLPAVINTGFRKYRFSAMGIYSSSSAVGGLFSCQLVQLMIEGYSLRGAFLIMSGTYLNGLVGCLMILQLDLKESVDCSLNTVSIKQDSITPEAQKRDKDETLITQNPLVETKHNEKNTREEASGMWAQIINLFLKREFNLLTILNCASMFNSNTVFLVMIDFVRVKGYTLEHSSYILTVIFGSQLCARFLMNWILDKKIISGPVYLILSNAVTCVLLFMYTCTSQFTVLVALTVLYGVIYGNTTPVINVMLADYVAKKDLAMALVIMKMTQGIAVLLRSLAVGALFNETNFYDHVFYLMSALCMFCCIIWIIEVVWKWMTAENKN